MRGRTVVPALATIALTVALTSGCGGSSGSAQVAQLATTPSTTTEPGGTTPTATTPGLPVCGSRVHGLSASNGFQIADPTLLGGAGRQRTCSGQLRADRNNPKFKKARRQVPFDARRHPGRSSVPRSRSSSRMTALKFAQCMRKNGVDVPDPDFSQGGGAGGGLFGGSGMTRNDPKVQKATQTCQKVFTERRPRRRPLRRRRRRVHRPAAGLVSSPRPPPRHRHEAVSDGTWRADLLGRSRG